LFEKQKPRHVSAGAFCFLMFRRCGACSGLIAGKPAPTGIELYTLYLINKETCGSWLASDEASQVSDNFNAV
jgi:hypothetical protein